MPLLAEEIVEEWLNRNGYFTIRGVKLGVQEMDLLAVRCIDARLDCRHLEVQASVRPIGYLTRVPKEVRRRTGLRAGYTQSRSASELQQAVREWVQQKFDLPEKRRVRERLAPGPWSKELVVHRVKYEAELAMIEREGVTVRRLFDLLADLKSDSTLIQAAAGAHLVDLIELTASLTDES